jgi:hypothetical protein
MIFTFLFYGLSVIVFVCLIRLFIKKIQVYVKKKKVVDELNKKARNIRLLLGKEHSRIYQDGRSVWVDPEDVKHRYIGTSFRMSLGISKLKANVNYNGETYTQEVIDSAKLNIVEIREKVVRDYGIDILKETLNN